MAARRVTRKRATPQAGDQHLDPHGQGSRRVIDFDAVIRDPAKPTQIKGMASMPAIILHGSDAGYAAMAAAIDFEAFKALNRRLRPRRHRERFVALIR